MLVNTRAVRIEWGDCDPAGIIFYALFRAVRRLHLGADRARARHDQARLSQDADFSGHPLVNAHSRFLLPTTFGDDVTIETTVTDIRRSSFVHHRLFKNGALAVEGFRNAGVGARRSNQRNDACRAAAAGQSTGCRRRDRS